MMTLVKTGRYILPIIIIIVKNTFKCYLYILCFFIYFICFSFKIEIQLKCPKSNTSIN